jgi:hypothetical protein
MLSVSITKCYFQFYKRNIVLLLKWTLNIITAAEIKLMRTVGYIHLDYYRNLDIMKEVNTQLIMEFVENYRANWKSHTL